MLAHRHCLAALALLSCTGCLGTEGGNPPLTSELTLDAHSTDPARVGLNRMASEATVSEVWVNLGDVVFVGDDNCAAASAVAPQVSMVGVDDHADDAFARVSFETTERDFCRVEVGLEVGGPLPAGAPPELATASIVVLGRRPDATPFVIVSQRTEPVSVVSTSDRFTLAEGRAGVFLGFDLATWLDGLDLSGATVGADGRITVAAGANVELREAFEANLAMGIELYLDGDGDAVPDEPTPLAVGQ